MFQHYTYVPNIYVLFFLIEQRNVKRATTMLQSNDVKIPAITSILGSVVAQDQPSWRLRVTQSSKVTVPQTPSSE